MNVTEDELDVAARLFFGLPGLAVSTAHALDGVFETQLLLAQSVVIEMALIQGMCANSTSGYFLVFPLKKARKASGEKSLYV